MMTYEEIEKTVIAIYDVGYHDRAHQRSYDPQRHDEVYDLIQLIELLSKQKGGFKK